MKLLSFSATLDGSIAVPSVTNILQIAATTNIALGIFTSAKAFQLPFDPQRGTGGGAAYQFHEELVRRRVGIAHSKNQEAIRAKGELVC